MGGPLPQVRLSAGTPLSLNPSNKGVILSEAKDLLLHPSPLPEPLQPPTRFIAIDWSGALAPAAQRRGIWLADCCRNDQDPTGNPNPITLRSGETRAAAESTLLDLATQTPALVAGLDFSFSYPAPFLAELGCASAPEFWARVAADGEQWLAGAHPLFWGRAKGSRQPAGHAAPGWLGYRQTERAATSSQTGERARTPSSSFQIGGAGAVGTGSLRGIPMLARLRQAGWSIWPFDPPRLPLLVEIYPRLLTGPVIKSSAAARARYLAAPEFHPLPATVRAAAAASEDAFDALISAWRMREHAADWPALPWPPDARTALEGAIWRPSSDANAPRS